MTTSLHHHLLLKLSKAQTLGEKGFTLVELLVVIIIIGILSAVALPSFLNQKDKAYLAEAKQVAGALARSEQAYYLENSSWLTSSCTALDGWNSAIAAKWNCSVGSNGAVTITGNGSSGKPAATITHTATPSQ